MKTLKTNCIVCWKPVEVSFNPPVKRAEVEVECCDGPPKMFPHILVVDDEPAVLRTLRRMLEKMDYIVEAACNEKEALSIISTEHIHLVISDLNLGTEDGLRLLDKIRKQRPEIKTILMSGCNLPEVDINILKIDSFLHKPFDYQELKEMVKNILNKKGGK